ncbi:MAG: transposon-transfer assisting family protein [Oscillospiraceae bacterium]|nr:transposon-transfer assisting family protein [Oscillospiraceae bacterium]
MSYDEEDFFEEDELIIISMFEKDNRKETIREIEDVLPFVKDDTEVESLVIGTIEKMKMMSDEEFSKLELEEYKQEPVDE